MPCESQDDCTSREYGEEQPDSALRWRLDGTEAELNYVLRNPLLPLLSSPRSSQIHLTRSASAVMTQRAWARPEASWQNMLITQPALSEATIDHASARHFHAVRARSASAGVTILDCLQSASAFGAFATRHWEITAAKVVQVKKDLSAVEVLHSMQTAGEGIPEKDCVAESVDSPPLEQSDTEGSDETDEDSDDSDYDREDVDQNGSNIED